MKPSKILVTCPKGITPILAQEVSALGLPVVDRLVSGVVSEGTLLDCMKLNLWVRTGHRVHWLLDQFKARNPDQLYDKVRQIPWEEYIPADGYISIASSVWNPTIRDTRFANLKTKDAICDRMRDIHGKRPNSGSDPTGVVVFVYWHGQRCSVYLDTSGEPLARRGYRKIPLKAPMQETLAAAVVLTSGWQPEENFVNPMCGSGTLAIEAALLGLNRAPGLDRRFAFMNHKDFNEAHWLGLVEDAKGRVQGKLPGRIIATDNESRAIAASRENARAAGVESFLEFGACDFAKTEVPEGKGVVVFNPEYGERMGEAQKLIPVYRRIGDFLKTDCKGYRGYVFTGNKKLFNKVSLRPSRDWTFFNSNIECRLLEYEIY